MTPSHATTVGGRLPALYAGCGVTGAVLLGAIRVIQLDCFGEFNGDVVESLVDFKDLGSVDVLRVRGREFGAYWEVPKEKDNQLRTNTPKLTGIYEPGAEFGRFLPGIYFILECRLNRVSSECDRPTVQESDLGGDSVVKKQRALAKPAYLVAALGLTPPIPAMRE